MANTVEVVPYNNAWPSLFQQEATKLKKILGDNLLAIHHVGSTSIPELSAKPIIDIIPVVKDITKVPCCSKAMEALGYDCMGEYGMPFRQFFTRRRQVEIDVNCHIFEEGSSEITRHILFRDYLRKHPEVRDAYARLKEDLAQDFPNDITAYCDGKSNFVQDIDRKTGFSGCRMVEPRGPSEVAAYKRIMGEAPIYETGQQCFVLLEDEKIIGAVRVNLDSKTNPVFSFEKDVEKKTKHYFENRVKNWVKIQAALK